METNTNQAAIFRLSFTRQILFRVLRTFFKLLYHQFAWAYDAVAWIVSLGSWRKWIKAVVPFLDRPRILEIGFGTGHLQAALLQKKIPVIGIDESQQMVQITRRRLVLSGLIPRLIRGEAQTLPFASQSFHQVVITFPAEYILKSATFSELQRILVKGGDVVTLPLAWITGRSPWERLAAWVNRITGEAPAWDPQVLEPLKETGFDISWEMVSLTNSKVVIVSMRKV